MGPSDLLDQWRRCRVLDVDAEVERSFEPTENCFECRDVVREFLEDQPRNGDFACPAANDAVVVQDNPSVACDPCVRLDSVCTQPQGQSECFEGVFADVRPCPSVGKADWSIRERRKTLLHPQRLDLRFYAGAVFNLSGSEIVFLLMAGLVVLGPERLPGVIRRVGRTYGEIRRTLTEYERDFKQTFKEPLDEVRSTVKDFRSSFGTIDTTPSPPMRPEKSSDPGVSSEASPSVSPFANAEMSAHPDRWRPDPADTGDHPDGTSAGPVGETTKESGSEDGSRG